MEKTGGLNLFTEALAKVSSPTSVTGMIALLTGIISTSSSSGVVMPAFIPIVRPPRPANSTPEILQGRQRGEGAERVVDGDLSRRLQLRDECAGRIKRQRMADGAEQRVAAGAVIERVDGQGTACRGRAGESRVGHARLLRGRGCFGKPRQAQRVRPRVARSAGRCRGPPRNRRSR